MADDATPIEDGAPEDGAAAEPERRHGALVTRALGQEVLHVEVAGYHDLVAALRDEGFEFCVDVTAVDYLTAPHRSVPEGIGRQRFEVVVNLLSMTAHARVRVRCQVPESDPTLPTIVDLYAGADAAEREVFDMFGIVFAGHPDLTRILMPEEWEGHPLRKDYGVGRIPVQFKSAPGAR
jgi:NADH-quinone oxidoreductase subunit C